jgi:hypothetical protein
VHGNGFFWLQNNGPYVNHLHVDYCFIDQNVLWGFVANIGNVIPTLQNVILFQLCFEIPTKFQGSSQNLTHVHVDKKKYAFIILTLKDVLNNIPTSVEDDVLIHKKLIRM